MIVWLLSSTQNVILGLLEYGTTYFSEVYRSRFIRTLLEVSFGIFSLRNFMVPQSGGFLHHKGQLESDLSKSNFHFRNF